MRSHTTSKTLSGSQNYESLRTIHKVNQQIKEFLKEEKIIPYLIINCLENIKYNLIQNLFNIGFLSKKMINLS